MSVRAAVLPGPGSPVEVRELPDPELGEGSVLLETVASEVCGTDVHLRHGRLGGVPFPIIPGHVSVGRIAALRGVEADALGAPLGAGDLVTFHDVHGICHDCWRCLVAGEPNRCRSRRVYGITHSADEGLFGGWAEAIHLLPDVKVVKLPPELDADTVIGGGCGLFTGFAAVERAGIRLGDRVVVQGTGPVGLAATAFAALAGAGAVVSIGAPAGRLEMALTLGADAILSIEAMSPGARRHAVLELTGGRGADVVIEATGNPDAVDEGLDLVRSGGTYVVAGQYTDAGPVSLNPHRQVNRKHVEIRGQWGTEFRHVHLALDLLAKHVERLPFERVIGGRYPLDEADRALDDVEELRVTKAIIEP